MFDCRKLYNHQNQFNHFSFNNFCLNFWGRKKTKKQNEPLNHKYDQSVQEYHKYSSWVQHIFHVVCNHVKTNAPPKQLRTTGDTYQNTKLLFCLEEFTWTGGLGKASKGQLLHFLSRITYMEKRSLRTFALYSGIMLCSFLSTFF